MAQRTIEQLIGRLVTDEAFRTAFLREPERLLLDLRDQGLELSATEIAALVGTPRTVWTDAADALDPRLQKSRLSGRPEVR